ncbi:hypothetical protein BB560_004972 [Smittium megazygosporum]|uniref:Uncharacterized protein n=1 Tax=Smittium megazygosporum TaxID=133381 RepID=A0A2T9Z7T1_9FUNG|nr:hypothetical protein BB560_004972 [Smittium megazygosporum]
MSGNQLTAYFEYSPANVISILGSDFSKYRNVIIGDDIVGRNCHYLRLAKVYWNRYNIGVKKEVREAIFDNATNQIVCEKELIDSMKINDFSQFYSCISLIPGKEVTPEVKQYIPTIFKIRNADQKIDMYEYFQDFKANFNKSICEYTTEFKRFKNEFDHECSKKVKKWASINIDQKNKNDCVEEYKANVLRNIMIDIKYGFLFGKFLLDNNFHGISMIWDFKEGLDGKKSINNIVNLKKYLNGNYIETNLVIKGEDIEIMKIVNAFKNFNKNIDEIPNEIFILRNTDPNQVSQLVDISSEIKESLKGLDETIELREILQKMADHGYKRRVRKE